jgi:hypothetical protein
MILNGANHIALQSKLSSRTINQKVNFLGRIQFISIGNGLIVFFDHFTLKKLRVSFDHDSSSLLVPHDFYPVQISLSLSLEPFLNRKRSPRRVPIVPAVLTDHVHRVLLLCPPLSLCGDFSSCTDSLLNISHAHITTRTTATLSTSCLIFLTNSLFEDIVIDSSGGAVYINTNFAVDSGLVVTDTIFTGVGCTEYFYGGAIFSTTGLYRLSRNCFSYCFAFYGQFLADGAAYSNRSLSHSLTLQNFALNGLRKDGLKAGAQNGGLFVTGSSSPFTPLNFTLSHSNFSQCATRQSGAAIDATVPFLLVTVDCVSVVDSTGDSIVAIEARRDVQSVVRNATFVDNLARSAILIGGFAVEGCVFLENVGAYFGRIGVGLGEEGEALRFAVRDCAFDGAVAAGTAWADKGGNVFGKKVATKWVLGTEGIVCFELPAFSRAPKSPAETKSAQTKSAETPKETKEPVGADTVYIVVGVIAAVAGVVIAVVALVCHRVKHPVGVDPNPFASD